MKKTGKYINCEVCNIPVWRKLSRIKEHTFCSQKHANIISSTKRLGKNHPNYKQIERNCLLCKKPFNTRKKQIDKGYGKYCSIKCASKVNNKNKTVPVIKKVCKNCQKIFIVKIFRTRKGFSKFCGRKCMGEWQKGKKRPEISGNNNYNWKGGITPLNLKLRHSVEYNFWRESVFKRDNYICIWCGTKGNINADHIQLFSERPDLRFAIDNGRTLCKSCHDKRHSRNL